MGTPHGRSRQARPLEQTLEEIEARRLVVQEHLDRAKTPRERNAWGQFATPPALAAEIAEFAWNLWKDAVTPVSFLDPAVGTGSFYASFRRAFAGCPRGRATGVELDPSFVVAARSLWRRHGLKVREADFTQLAAPGRERYNLVLTNPPYVRHHHLAPADKRLLQNAVHEGLGLKISGLAGLYCYFLLLCHDWMEDDGLACWLIPSEFMTVNYGKALRSYLTHHVKLLRVHRFSACDVQFADALVTSSVVAFRKAPPDADHRVSFTYGGSVLHPKTTEVVAVRNLRRITRWARGASIGGSRGGGVSDRVALGDLFTVKRGLATGANGFFILPLAEAELQGIPRKYLRPILPSPRYLRQDVVESRKDGYPDLDTPLALIDCDLPEETIRRRHPGFWHYLRQGAREGVAAGYLASRRRPWYSQEKRPPTPFLCTYMGRKRARGRPFRFIWDKSEATAANVYLLLYPRGPLADLLRREPNLGKVVHRALSSIGVEDLIEEGRVYGGGLQKLEPRELGRVPARSLMIALRGRVRPFPMRLSL